MPTTSELRNNDALPAGDAIEAADGVPMYDASLDKTVSVPGDRFAAVDVLESGSEVLEDAKAIDFDGSQFDVAKNGSGVEVSIASTFDTGVNSFQNRTGEVVLQTEDVGDGLAIDTTPSPNQIRVPDGAIGVAKLSTLTGNIGFDESGPTERGVEFLETTPNIRWLRAPSSGRALEVVDASAGDDLLWLDEDGNLRVTGEVEAFADGSGTSPDSPNSELQVLDDGTSLTMDAQSIDFQGGTVNQNGDEITVDVNAGTDFQAGDNLAFDTSTDPKTLDVTKSFYTDADAVNAVEAATDLSPDLAANTVGAEQIDQAAIGDGLTGGSGTAVAVDSTVARTDIQETFPNGLDVGSNLTFDDTQTLSSVAGINLEPQNNAFIRVDKADSSAGTRFLRVTHGSEESVVAHFGNDDHVGLAGVTDPSYALEVGGDMRATGEVEAFLGSDRRLKSDLTAIARPLERMQKISGYAFDWDDRDPVQPHKRGTEDVGLVAQEVEEVLPEAVKELSGGHTEGYKAVEYDKVVPLLVEAVKEQQQQIQQLKQEV